jgi:hypothetical protein
MGEGKADFSAICPQKYNSKLKRDEKNLHNPKKQTMFVLLTTLTRILDSTTDPQDQINCSF